jgi:tRNA (cytosine49-C5)-methyltransferase
MTLPAPFKERITSILPAEFDLDGCFQPRAKVCFRVNTLKADPAAIKDIFKAQGLLLEDISWYLPAFLVSKADAQKVLDSPEAKEGQIYAQGLESMLPVTVLDVKPGQTVLDLCAAPGSKTTQIAAHMNNEGLLWANEPVVKRFYRLKSVVQLMGAKVQVLKEDGRYLRKADMFDRILVDAPCSSEGRFCVDGPESFGYWSVRKIHEMAHKQKGLLLNAVRMLKPGGILVYSTCTFAPEENEAVLDWLLRKAPEVKLLDVDLKDVPRYPALTGWNNKEFDPQVQKSFRVLPGKGYEGFFIAKMIKA